MIRNLIPPKARRWVYLALAVALAVVTVLAPEYVDTVVQLAAVAGFTLAAGNTPAEGEDVG